MKDQEINEAVASAMGIPFDVCQCGDGIRGGHDNHHFTPMAEVPNFCEDLNAMAEAEQALRLNAFEYVAYFDNLFFVVTGLKWTGDLGYFSFNLITATARQRAEAFLRTKGLWK